MQFYFAKELARLAPKFAERAELARSAQLVLFARSVVGAPDVPRAARLIAVLAASDVGDLIDDVGRGSGRAAMRTARTLIEHAINMHSVLASAEAADRYMAHLAQGPMLLGDAPGIELLEHRLERSARHEARVQARDAQPIWNKAITEYGSGFRRQWHPANLHDRAAAAGLEELYDLYRLGSAVTHGSSAGAIGQFALPSLDGAATYAAGRVPSLVPWAIMWGTNAYLRMLTFLEDAYPQVKADASGGEVNWLMLDHIDAIWRAAKACSTQSLEPVEAKGWLAFSARGKQRWYVESSNDSGRWQPALDDDDAPIILAWLAPVMEAYIKAGGTFNEGNLAAIHIPFPLHPDMSKASVPSDAMPIIVRDADGSWVSGRRADETTVVDVWVVHPGTDDTHFARLLDESDPGT